MWRRFPCVRQDDQSDCGAAAIATVAIAHGQRFSVQVLRQAAGTDRQGTNLQGLINAADQIGMTATAVKGTEASLNDIPLPSIAHVKTAEGLGHFVVIHRVTRRHILIADPARGICKLSRKAFLESWTGYLLLISPDANWASTSPTEPTALNGDRLPKNESNVTRFFRLVRPHRGLLVEALCCALLMTVLGISTSFFIQHLVDSVLVRREANLLNALGMGMILIILFRSLFELVRQFILAYIARAVDLTLVSNLTRHILHLPMTFFETRQVGEVLSRINDTSKVREAISGTALSLLVDGIMVTTSLSVLWIYDVRLAAVATLFIPLLVAAIVWHHPKAKRLSQQTMEDSARLSAALVEDVSAAETIKALGIEQGRENRTCQQLTTVLKSSFSLQMLGLRMGSCGLLITGVAGIVVLWYGGHRVMAGALTIGQLMFFHSLLGYLLAPLERLTSVNLQLQEARVAMTRLNQILELPTETADINPLNAPLCEPADIELADVSFAYGCRDTVLRNICLTIPKSSQVAFVGESGSGKSTLLKLLMRFYEPTEGRISTREIDLRDLDLTAWRNSIGVVSQDPFIFNGTIRENLTAARPDASIQEILKYAQIAGLSEFIDQLPDRYETMIGERGANLSGGQRQRIAIARALIGQPQIFIFDEATSHLDSTTEANIQKSLEQELAGKTVIKVAHRLSTICSADVIFVMDRGQIIERGTHPELLAVGGKYAELWRAQTGQHQFGDRPQTAGNLDCQCVTSDTAGIR